jgi:perosamine synthetase
MEGNKFIPVCEPSIIGNESKYVNDCLDTNWISSSGKYIGLFEEAFAKYCNTKYGIGTCNGTVSLHLALEALGIGPGDEVIIPDFTMIASANSVIYTGATPVFADADIETWCINPELIGQKITKKTKAIMPVHIYGNPCDMDPINKIAKAHDLSVIEDAAEAHGALYKNKKTGSLGDAASFSFYANKILTTGEGGMAVTSSEKLAERMRLLKNHAFTKDRFTHQEIGYNYRMTNIQAAIGLAQVENADKLVQMRINNAQEYNKRLKNIKGLILPPKKEWAKNVYWMYGIMVNEEFGMPKDRLREALLNHGIDTRSFFVPLHKQPLFTNKSKFKNMPGVSGNFPVSEALGRDGLYLPSTSTLPKEKLIFIADTIKKIKDEIK